MSIHHNLAPVSSTGTPTKALYLAELLELFDEHPNTSFIWCHAGISRRVVVDDLPGRLRHVLVTKNRRKHVSIDLSWVVYEDYIYDPSQGIDNRDSWSILIKDFPGTFMIGSDKVGNFAGYDREIGKYSPLFEVLERKAGMKVVRRVAHDNFLKLMQRLRERRGGGGLRLPDKYQYPERNFTVKSGKYLHDNPRP